MPYTIAIVEDDPVQLEHLAGLVERAALGPHAIPIETIEPFTSAAAFAAWVEAGAEPDIVLMDIVLDEAAGTDGGTQPSDGTPPGGTSTSSATESGIDLVADLFGPNSPTQVIYVTGYAAENPHVHSHVYRTAHVSFLTKPVDPDELAVALSRAAANRAQVSEQPLVLRVDGATVPVWPHAIVYIESYLNRLAIRTRRRSYQTYGSLERLFKQLPASFVRCHRSFAVNMDYIQGIDHGSLLVPACPQGSDEARPSTVTVGDDGIARIPISQNRRKPTREAYLAYIAAAERLR